jgi:lipoyl(octanoyl) transferase
MQQQAGYPILKRLKNLATDTPIQLKISEGLTDYRVAEAEMEALAGAIAAGEGPETLWLVEHPPLYTAGISAKDDDLLVPDRFPVYRTGRGGQFTYHGPGQRVAYVMLDLRSRGRDVHAFVSGLEQWLIAALAQLGVSAGVRPGRVGVWVQRSDGREDKIAAIGVKVRRWVTFHGIALNVAPDLTHFSGIVPCGLRQHGVTSLADLGLPAAMTEADAALLDAFSALFGPLGASTYDSMTKPDSQASRTNAASEEGGDWFYDELMTPQPDATQAYFRSRLKALATPAEAQAQSGDDDLSA